MAVAKFWSWLPWLLERASKKDRVVRLLASFGVPRWVARQLMFGKRYRSDYTGDGAASSSDQVVSPTPSPSNPLVRQERAPPRLGPVRRRLI